MNKKALYFLIVLFTCFIILITSYIQWRVKLSSFNNIQTTSVKTEERSSNEGEKVPEKLKSEITDTTNISDLLLKTANQDQVVQDLFKKRFDSGEKVNFLIVGSTYMNSGSPGYGDQLSLALTETYGNHIQVEVKALEGSSSTLVDDLKNIFNPSTHYDIVLLEPFTLNNNGVVTPEDQHKHIVLIQKKIQSFVPDSVLVLHPAQPLPNGVFYPKEVQVLREFAQSKNIPYINHWGQWVDANSAVKNGLVDDNSEPTTEGAKVWSNALINYFIAE